MHFAQRSLSVSHEQSLSHGFLLPTCGQTSSKSIQFVAPISVAHHKFFKKESACFVPKTVRNEEIDYLLDVSLSFMH